MFLRRFLILSVCIFFSCNSNDATKTDQPDSSTQDLFSGFQNPPAEARPFVRWWWNGNKIKQE